MDFTNKKQLLGAAGALALIIGGGGILLGRTVFAPEQTAAPAPAAAPAKGEGKEAEGGEAEHGPEGLVALVERRSTKRLHDARMLQPHAEPSRLC